MDNEEPILLHEQDLMLALLHAAAEGPATVQGAVARLRGMRAVAGEADAVDEEVMRRLRRAALALRAAGALARIETGTLKITERGRELLASSPEGIDETALMRFAEFRAFISGSGSREPRGDPRMPAFDAGQLAFTTGKPLTENPFPFDSVDHLAWENGWSEARDEASG